MDATLRQPVAMPRTFAAAPDRRESILRVNVAAVFVYLLFIPQQFNITIATIYLSPFRVYLLGATIYILSSAVRRSLRFAWPDLCIVLAVAWIWIASVVTSGSMATGAVMGGSHLVDIGLAYFLARATIQTPDDLRRLLILIFPVVAITGAIIAAEALSRTYLLQPLASAVTGQPMPLSYEIRKGLLRGSASFPHPILAGIVMASFLSLYFLSGIRSWPRILGVAAAIMGMFSMSSAAMLGVVIGGLLVAYEKVSERVSNLTWRLFLFFAAVLYIVIEFTSKSGFYSVLIRYASLNTGSAYNRILIWNYGTANIKRHPWFGIGYGDWERPDWMHWSTFDHYWLINPLRFGIPAGVLLLGATLIAIIMVMLNSRRLPPVDARLLRGVAISTAVFALGLNSVSLWLAALAWFYVLVGIAVSLGSHAPERQPTFAPVRPFANPRLIPASI